MSQNCLVHRRDSYARQSVPETIRETAVPRTAECEKGAADRAVTDHGNLTVKLTADTLRLQMNHVCTKKEFWYRKRVP